jgi:hypothetical protein
MYVYWHKRVGPQTFFPFLALADISLTKIKLCMYSVWRVLGSSVGIVTAYGLDGPGIESRWRQNFPHLSRPAMGPTQSPVEWVTGLSRGKERPGRDADPSPPSSAVGHGRVEIYLYSPYGSYGLHRASELVQGCKFLLHPTKFIIIIIVIILLPFLASMDHLQANIRQKTYKCKCIW